LKRNRPVINVIGDSFSDPPSPWQHLGQTDIKRRLTDVIPSVGRIELPNHWLIPYAGTGFVVGSNLLMTNRHVAEIFSTGLGTRRLEFRSGLAASVDFKREILPSPPVLLDVRRVVMIHPFWDMALL
jgi:hypothetical protein